MSAFIADILLKNCFAQLENDREEISWVAVHKLQIDTENWETTGEEAKFKVYCNRLTDALESQRSGLENFWEIHIHYKWTRSQPQKLKVRIGGPFFGTLKKLLSFADIPLYFHAIFFAFPTCRVELMNAPDISLLEFGEGETGKFCEEIEAQVRGNVAHLWSKQNGDFSRVTAVAYLSFAVKDHFINFQGNHSNQLKSLCNMMLEQNVHTDFTIVASNGKGLKCHKCFLAIHSPVFKRMLENEFKESKACELILEGESEEFLTALLEYIYTLEINQVVTSSAVAVGVFQLAHKYEMLTLEELLENMSLQRGNGWFDLDPTLELFCFARKLELSTDELKTKLFRVLKSKGNDFMSPQVYRQLFAEDGEAAMELCAAMAITE